MISLSNLYKKQYCFNLATETRVINADERYRQSIQATIKEEQSFPSSGEMIDGFLAGLDAEEIQLESQVTPEEILEQARIDSEAIIARAQAEALQITSDANRRADMLFEQKKQLGYQEGVSRLQDEILERKAKLQEEFEQKELELQQMAQALQMDYEAKLEVLEADMVDVMIQVFHKVFNIQFDNKKQILLHLIKDTMLGIDACKEFVVRVADGNYKFIESHVADIKEKIGNDVSIDVVNDRNLEEDDCIIETATGVYNCSIDMVLSNLEKDIKSLCR